MKNVYRVISALGLLSITHETPLEGTNKTWVGGSDNRLDEDTNWSPIGEPGSSDTAFFTTTGSHSPGTFGIGDSSFSVGTFQITDPITAYFFNITPSDVPLTFSFEQDGVYNKTQLEQTLQFSPRTTLIFDHSSSANFQPTSSTGNVIYNIFPTVIVDFNVTSTASNAIFNVNDAQLSFNGSSDPNQAVINVLDGGILNFSTTTKSTNGGPFLTLFDTSVVNVNNSNRIATLNSASTTTQVNIGAQTFTIQQPIGQHDVYAGELNGTGIFNLNDASISSSLTLTGDNCTNFTGTTNINLGQLILDGSLGGTINVFSVLSGTGLACDTVRVKNGGIIFPGDNDKIGTLFADNYVNAKKGFYLTLVNGNGHSSLIDTNTTALHGGTVVAASSNGTFLVDTPYLIVHANNGLVGKYTRALQEINPYLVAKLSYDPNNVFLTLNTNFAGFTKTENQEEVAEQLDSIQNPSAALEDFLLLLTTLTPSQLQHALDELSGVQYASIFPTFQKATERFFHGLDLPTRLWLADPCEFCECYEFWGDVQYGRSFIQGDHEARGYRQQNINGFIATQMKLDCNFKVGAAAYYENDILRFHLNGKARNNIILGSVFGIYQDDCFYFLSDFIGGYFHGNYRRHIDIVTDHFITRAHPRAYNGSYYGELGLAYFDCCGLSLQPYIGGEGGWYHIQSFEEDGSAFLNLHGKNQNYTTADSFLGLRLATSACGLSIMGEAAWQHSYTAWGNHIKLEFDQFGDEFKIRGPKQGRDGFVGNFTVAVEASDYMSFYAELDGERWKHYTTYSLGLGIDLIW